VKRAPKMNTGDRSADDCEEHLQKIKAATPDAKRQVSSTQQTKYTGLPVYENKVSFPRAAKCTVVLGHVRGTPSTVRKHTHSWQDSLV